MELQRDQESSEDGWPEAETHEEAAEILHETVFEFAEIVLNLVVEDEKNYPNKYRKKTIKPSTKIRVLRALLEMFDKAKLAEHYTNYVLSWKHKIDGRDEDFFLKNDHIFPGAPKEDIEFFRDLWRPNSTFHLTGDEKETVFEYFDTMLHFCGEWKKLMGYRAKWEDDDFDPEEEYRRRRPEKQTSNLYVGYDSEYKEYQRRNKE